MKPSHRKNLKALFVVVLILLILTVIVLYFIFKPKPPVVIATPVSLLHFEFSTAPKIILSVTLGVDVFLNNPNLAPFMYNESVATIYYRGVCVGEAPIAAGTIGVQATKDIGTPVELLVNRIISNPKFLSDVTNGVLTMISTSKTEGQATFLGFVKLHATITVDCYVSVFLWEATISSKCVSKIKI